eukprot:12678434-Ditylum_brightwellii.AAC.1
MKETVTRIGYLTKINPVRIYCANCQEQLNEALDIVAAKIEQEDNAHFQNYGTKWWKQTTKCKLNHPSH